MNENECAAVLMCSVWDATATELPDSTLHNFLILYRKCHFIDMNVNPIYLVICFTGER